MKRQISDTLNLLWYQYNDQEFCDVTVHCNDGRRYCNSFMLLTLGEFWTEVISDSYTGDSNIHVTIPDVNVQTFDYLVEIILNGEVSVPNREANKFIADSEELVPDVNLWELYFPSNQKYHGLQDYGHGVRLTKPRKTKFKRNKKPDCSQNCHLHCPNHKEKEAPKTRKIIEEF